MGFYIRKAIAVGPLRFNLSKSGVGVSAGVRGLRLGTGPRGNYVHMGRGGLYFRQSLGPATPSPPPRAGGGDRAPAGEFQELESGSVLQMVDGSSADLLRELNEKRRKVRILPLVAFGGGLVVLALAAAAVNAWVILAALVLASVSVWLAATKDALRKTTVVLYDLEPDATAAYEALHAAIGELQASSRVWHVEARAGVQDAKYHAGAGSLVKLRPVSIAVGQPPLLKRNVDVPLIPAGRQVLAFMPDRLLVFESSAVGAVAYVDLAVERTDTRFIEEGAVPNDATAVGTTWRYVNKKGGPDKRFRDNRELPICAYSRLQFTSQSGLHEVFQMSRRGAGESMVAALAAMGHLAQSQPDQPV